MTIISNVLNLTKVKLIFFYFITTITFIGTVKTIALNTEIFHTFLNEVDTSTRSI